MGKSYRRHNKRPKRKNTRRRRRGGADGTTTSSSNLSFSPSSMTEFLQKKYQDGYNEGKEQYKSFKYSNPANFALAKSAEKTAMSMQPTYEKAKSSMASMGSSMGFSSLSSNNPSVKELAHAQQQARIGTPMQNNPYNPRQMISLV